MCEGSRTLLLHTARWLCSHVELETNGGVKALIQAVQRILKKKIQSNKTCHLLAVDEQQSLELTEGGPLSRH
ncbi:hypothetical protein NDU88_001807 [Pleurodeles waltl]|uniref:Uncharacterized protein n=1 Tax=Pleurodeles waltl TaxID=8319 RepID=A0AAV7NBT2_PLEWA|nr:hypothetical protein NDU88_001807 [Pleurodeles waltl]